MAREHASLLDIGIDESLLDNQPTLSKVVQKKDIDDYIERMKEHLPNVDLTLPAINKRKLHLATVEQKIKRAEATIAKWKRMQADFSALKAYDDVLLKMHDELKSQKGLTSCGALGNVPAPKKRVREYPQPIRYPEPRQMPYHDDNSSQSSTVTEEMRNVAL